MSKHPMKDVIVLLPGILGSVLSKDGKEIWSPSPGAIGRSLWKLGRNLNDLALGDDPWDVDDLGDGVTATRVLPDVHIIPGLWGIDGYSGISKMIQSTFDVTEGVNFFELPYDWRRDNRVAARALKQLADEALFARRKEVSDAKLVLVGHSMGGIVSRYYLECLDGWKDTRSLITFGTPYRGSLNAVEFIANGFVKKLGPLKLIDLTKLLHSLTSVYQLLPRYPCIDLDDGNGYVRPAETGDHINGMDITRAEAALQFHFDIDNGAASHGPDDYAIHSIVGAMQTTKQSARFHKGKLLVEAAYNGVDDGGDGTVPRGSATPIEKDGTGYQPMYSADKHASLQNDDAVQNQLTGILTERDFSALRGRPSFRDPRGIAVDVPESLSFGEHLDVSAGRPDGSTASLDLAANVVDLATGREVYDQPVELITDSDGVHTVELPPLPSGDYRVVVTGVGDSADQTDPVHSLLCVFDDVEPD